MMGTDTGLHADQAGRHIGEACFHLPTRPLLPERDGAAPIEADDVKPVLADIDTDRGDHTLQDLGHGVLLSFGASASLRADRGQEHGRTIPLAVFAVACLRTTPHGGRPHVGRADNREPIYAALVGAGTPWPRSELSSGRQGPTQGSEPPAVLRRRDTDLAVEQAAEVTRVLVAH